MSYKLPPPKEKAIEFVNEFMPWTKKTDHYGKYVHLENAKQCALIAIVTIRYAIRNNDMGTKVESYLQVLERYWQEVEKEVRNLK